jgi:hypothetical protein
VNRSLTNGHCIISKHLKTHERPFECSVAGYSAAFARNSDLQRHDRSVHKQERKFWCTVSACIQKDVGFTRRDLFIQHLGTHSSSTAPDAKPNLSALTTPSRKKRRRSLSPEEQDRGTDAVANDEIIRLRAEVEILRLRAEKLEDTVYIQAGSIHALLSPTVTAVCVLHLD